MNWQVECSRELVLAVFRLAVADYLGITYGHDGPVPHRPVRSHWVDDARAFLSGSWARYLGDIVGLPSFLVWQEARRLHDNQGKDWAGMRSSGEPMASSPPVRAA
ncbi:MAG: hypothetical protein ACREEC_08985 [Thermoplasmata archaeon]